MSRKTAVFGGVLAAASLLLGVFASEITAGPRVYVNGERVNADVILKDDRTYLPLRAVAEAMGAEVRYEEDTDCVFVNFTEEDARAKVIEEASKSVVAIIGNYYQDTNAAGRYNKPRVHGSGVIVKSNGAIVTNAHVVENLRNITVVLYDGTMLPGTVVASDEKADVALVKVNKLGLAPITFAQDSPVAGKTAMVIGTPVSMSMRGSVTAGIVSGTDVTLADSYYKLLQTDAAINPGNSGGAIINAKGELIGLASSKFVNVQIESICFGIPADTVRYVLDCFDAFGGVVYPDFGVTLEQSFEAEIGLPTAKGLTVTKAPAGGTLAAGDVIHTVGGHSVSSLADFHEAVRKTYMGVPLAITYRKGGENGEEVAGTLAAIAK